MRALVIGGDGFAGRWLIRHLVESGDTVDALVGPRFVPPLPGASHVMQADVRDLEVLTRSVAGSDPEVIYYLAGVSHQGGRDVLPAAVGVSVVGSMNSLIAASAIAAPPRILYVSTGLVYREADRPLREDDPTSPNGMYAVAKLVGEEALARLAGAGGTEVVIARPFNHIGPGQKPPFIVPSLASQIGEVVGGRSEAISVRSVSPIRDFSDVRDVVRGYRLLATHAESGSIHNIASGSGTSIGTLIDTMLDIAGVSVRVESLDGDGEGPLVSIGDASLIRSMGWKPEYALRQTLEDVMAEHLT